jgi:hypothetical protein
MVEPLVAVVGAKALRKDINRMTKDERSPLYSAMKKAGYAAISPIVPAARAAIPQSDRKASGRHRPGALAGSIRASAYKSGAAIRMGSKAVPWAGWVEFGGTRRRPRVSERPYVKSGRYLFPAARALSSRAASSYSDALNTVFAQSGVWTNSSDSAGSVHD